MTKKNVYFIRHGEAEHNVNNDLTLKNPKLTHNGITQCNKMKKFYDNKPIDIIIVSPLYRTLQTASLLFPNKKIIAYEEIRESIHNPCDYRESVSDIKDTFGSIDFTGIENIDPFKDLPLKETLQHKLDRCKAMEKYIKSLPYDNIAIVSHRSFIKHYMLYFHNKDIFLDNCKYVEIII